MAPSLPSRHVWGVVCIFLCAISHCCGCIKTPSLRSLCSSSTADHSQYKLVMICPHMQHCFTARSKENVSSVTHRHNNSRGRVERARQVLHSNCVQALPPPGRAGARTHCCLGAQPGPADHLQMGRLPVGSADCDDFRGENYGYFSLSD